MKICPKCRGLYFDDDIECQNCKIELLDKDYFNEVLGEYYQMNFETRVKERYNPRYETICKYQFSSVYEYDEERSKREYEAMQERWRRKRAQQARIEREQNAPKCPTCGSTNIKRITTLDRAISIGFLGLLSGDIGKNYECLNCKAKW